MNAQHELTSAYPAPLSSGRGRPMRYPFHLMRVGESFLTDKRGQYAVAKWKLNHPGWDYVTRSEGDGFRVWRTK